MPYLGDFNAGVTVWKKFSTVNTSAAPTTLAGTPTAAVYKNGSTTESTAGVTLTVDFDGRTGMHEVAVDLSADGTFYAAGSDFMVVLTAGTVGGVSVVGAVLAEFSIENRNDKADVREYGGTAGTFSGGRPEVNATHFAGTAFASAVFNANMAQISGDATAADNLEAAFDGTGGVSLTLGSITVTNPAGNAVTFQSTGGNGHGIAATGHGTGAGVNATGGSTSGTGIAGAGGGSGFGIYGLGGATNADGIRGAGQGSGCGIRGNSGTGGGAGILGAGSAASNAPGIQGTGNGTGSGIRGVAGSTGHGMELSATSGDGLRASGGTNGNGINAVGVGTGVDLVADNLTASFANVDARFDDVDSVLVAVAAKTTNLPSDPADASELAALIDVLPTNAELATAITTGLTTALAEGYRGTNATGSVRDLLYEIIAHMGEFTISGTTKTTKKVDGSTTAKTYTLNDATNPTGITEAT